MSVELPRYAVFFIRRCLLIVIDSMYNQNFNCQIPNGMSTVSVVFVLSFKICKMSSARIDRKYCMTFKTRLPGKGDEEAYCNLNVAYFSCGVTGQVFKFTQDCFSLLF